MDQSVKKVFGLLSLALALGACTANTKTAAESTDSLPGFALSNLDTTAAPCTNFFQYVSGGWAQNNPMPETESRWGNFGILQEQNQKRMRGLLDSLAQVDNFSEDAHYAQLLSVQYQAGLDTTALDQAGAEPLSFLRSQLQGIQSWEDYLNWLPQALKQGFGAPFGLSVGVDDKNSEASLLNLSSGSLGLPDRDYYLNDDSASQKLQSQYRQHIAAMFSLLEIQEAEAQNAAEAIYAFEKQLAQHKMSRTERRKPENTYHKMSVADASKLAEPLQLDQTLSALSLQVDSLNVSNPGYWQELATLLPQTDLVTLKQYHLWHVLRATAGYLSADFEQESFNFYQSILRGVNQMKPRWRRVLSSMGNGLSEPLGRVFAQRYFPEEAKQAVEQMVEDLRTAYGQRIKQLTWMGDSTKERALEKLAAFNYKIGYPDVWKDFSDLQLEEGTYFSNHLKLRAYGVHENWDKLGQPVDKDEWFMPAYLVNAYYSSSYNEIVFPAGILQAPFYDVNADAAINYGGIGGVIGHEFSHGFDDQGSKYDGYGNLNQWWTDNDRSNFEDRTQVMVEQYNQYEPLPHLHVNGEMTLGENIADLGGLTMAYYGYQERLQRTGETPETKAGFSWQQRIFLGWGQVWQTVQKDEYTKNQVMTDYHSPARYRVNGPVSNMPEFWEAWSCEKGDALVRTDSLQVEIW